MAAKAALVEQAEAANQAVFEESKAPAKKTAAPKPAAAPATATTAKAIKA